MTNEHGWSTRHVVEAAREQGEALMALTLQAARPLPSGTVRYAAPFGIPV